MITRSNACANDINLQINLVRMDLPPSEVVLQRNEEGLGEDERLIRLLDFDLKGFAVAMHTKRSQIAIRTAEAVFQKAEDEFQRAKALVDGGATQDHMQIVRANNEPAMDIDTAETAYLEAYAKLLGIKGIATRAEKEETEYAAKAEKERTEYNARILKDATGVAYVKHMLEPKFPAELLKSVLDAVVRLQRLRWRPKDSDLLDDVVDQTFALPLDLDKKMRELCQEERRVALLNKAIIELPAEFTGTRDDVALVIPRPISGREKAVYHLILDIELDARDGVPQRQLVRAGHVMRTLPLRFPNLKVFVVCLLISSDNDNSSSGSGSQSFTPETLMLRHVPSWKGPETLEASLAKFISVLRTTGPGDLKFVRFADQSVGASNSFAHAGPLVRLSTFGRPKAEDEAESTRAVDAAAEDPTAEKPTAGDSIAEGSIAEDLIVGEQVLEQAYCYHHDTAIHP